MYVFNVCVWGIIISIPLTKIVLNSWPQLISLKMEPLKEFDITV